MSSMSAKINTRSPKWYGWLPDLPDQRDFAYTAIKSLAQQGVCPEAEWPYRIRDFTKKPSRKCYSDAEKHQITSYLRISTVDEMRTCLADGFPFVFGFTVYSAFESAAVAKTGVL